MMRAVEKDVILTPDGYEKLKEQIEDLETNKRREVADRIREAREFGDISENSEYDDAKNEQALLEHRIARLKEQLRSARVIDPKAVTTDVVGVGTRVKVKDVDAGDIDTYQIVGSAEADPAQSRLSNESPVGPRPARSQEGRDRRGVGARGRHPAQDHGHQGVLTPSRRRSGQYPWRRVERRRAADPVGPDREGRGPPPGRG